jgi:hypothetical protein
MKIMTVNCIMYHGLKLIMFNEVNADEYGSELLNVMIAMVL